MIDANNPRGAYFYSASAMALGGTITRPFQGIIESQAATTLPIDGGMGTARVENFQFKEIVSFKAGYSLVTGSPSEEERSFATMATAAVDELNIHHMVTVTKIVSRLTAHAPFQAQRQREIPAAYLPSDPGAQPTPGTVASQSEQPTLSPVGSRLTGLNVAGCELEVELDTETFSKLDKPTAYRAARARKGAVVSNGMVITSLVKEIKKVKGSCSGITVDQELGQIDVPQFGRIHIAQFLLTPFSWRLVMLRVRMGCSTAGALDSGCTQGNGVPP
ncbi:MAG TPA: hypothetical protein VK699_14565 [Terriglobales bacterium]|jgi:hypothetical protein|nr:hypothetical protein [Terriglobales bacterium]